MDVGQIKTELSENETNSYLNYRIVNASRGVLTGS
jgi:hypothetical protein